MSITVRAATAGRWGDVASVFSGRGGSTCWCRRFAGAEEADKPGALRREIEHAEQPVGLIAYVDDEPAGWTRVAPRASIPGVAANRSLSRFYLGDHAKPAWWISCFVVRREHRGAGVGLALLREAARFARRNGAAVLDGHPVDAARLRRHPSPAAVFTGTRSVFVAAGFREIGRTYPTRPVMRRDLRP